jgi:DNA-binding HxlR family transcriptional regulator
MPDDDSSRKEPDMTGPSFKQFCGIARAFEIIGTPWAAIIVRDLLLGPKRLTDLAETLPRMTADDLDARLGELEAAGVVRRSDPGPDVEVGYELTDYGKDLEPILLQLGRWGARSLGDPRPGDLFSRDMAILALRSTFRPERARNVRASFEVRFGEMVVGARVDDGALTVEEGELPDADLIIDTPVLKHLMAAEVTPTDALWLGLIEPKGDPSRLSTFVELFHIPEAPELPSPTG